MKQCLILLATYTLVSCTLFAPGVRWPDGAYPQDYFAEAFATDQAAQQYQTEDDYLLWITRFYKGFSIAPGWLSLTEQVLENLEEPQKSEVNQRLYHLGAKIGTEWAKDNEVRKLNTRNASVWRDGLIESLRQNDLNNYITRVEEDVESILNGELDKEEIYFERYYVDEFDF